MSGLPIRDQKNDHLLTPDNAALIIIDYQPVQVMRFIRIYEIVYRNRWYRRDPVLL